MRQGGNGTGDRVSAVWALLLQVCFVGRSNKTSTVAKGCNSVRKHFINNFTSGFDVL